MTGSRGSILDDGTKDIIGVMMPILNEHQRRIFLSAIAENLGWGSSTDIAELTGISMQTLTRGRKEIASLQRDPTARPSPDGTERIRSPGGGRKSKVDQNPEIRDRILSILDGNIIGDPMSPI